MCLLAGDVEPARVGSEAHAARIARHGDFADDRGADRIDEVYFVRCFVGHDNPTTVRRQDGGLGLGADLETLNNLTLGHVHDRERRVVLINDIKPTVPVNRDSFRIDAGWQCVDHLQSFCIDHAHVVAIAAGDERAAAIVTHGDAARTLADG